ncbi:hypothetical protein [Bradyrhizobium sp. USDA 4341]
MQNAWDAPGVTRVDLTISPVPGEAKATLSIIDDSPTGFTDLAHSFTLFADSTKKSDPTLRGRFNLGEKLVLALCQNASIATTTGTVVFDGTGRHDFPRRKRPAGTEFTATMAMTRTELAEVADFLRSVIPPVHIVTRINGRLLPQREPILSFQCALPTEIAGEDGVLRRTTRKTTVSLYEPAPGAQPKICEMGIPVTESDRFDVDVGQKVPLSLERDSLPPAYIRELRAAVLSNAAHLLDEKEADSAWVSDAIEHRNVDPGAVSEVITKRFGDKVVAYDPSDREANDIAASRGYRVIHGGTFTGAQWENVRASGAAKPAGQVTPSPKPFDPNGEPAKRVERTPAMEAFAGFCQAFAQATIGHEIEIEFLAWFNATAAYGRRRMSFNVGNLGPEWFEGALRVEQIDLVIHELGHEYAANHFSREYNDALTKLGAQAVRLALDNPGLFDITHYAPTAADPPTFQR